MLGLSRKSFISEITSESLPAERLVGSIAAMLGTLRNGVNIFRVHDVKETVDAIKVWNISK
jgi:dihydropteroate synthase